MCSERSHVFSTLVIMYHLLSLNPAMGVGKLYKWWVLDYRIFREGGTLLSTPLRITFLIEFFKCCTLNGFIM